MKDARRQGVEVRRADVMDSDWDDAATGLTLRRHPLAILRPELAARGLLTAELLRNLSSGRAVKACGIVTVRQPPETAHGTMYVSLEDEIGCATRCHAPG